MTTSLDRFKKNAPKGYCGDPGRGAAMGRADINPKAEPTGPLTVCFVERYDGGYDACGTYWGCSSDHGLYFAYGNDKEGNDIEMIFWAKGDVSARKYMLNMYPDNTVEVVEGEVISSFSEDEAEEENELPLWEATGREFVDALAEEYATEELPAVLGDAVGGMCLRACDHGAGAHDLAEMLREVARRLDSADEDVVQDRRDEGAEGREGHGMSEPPNPSKPHRGIPDEENALIALTAFAFVAVMSSPVQARDVKHYITVCGNGDVLVTCTQPFCDEGSAYYKAREVCSDRKGAADLVVRHGPRSAQEALVSEVEQAIALKQREERAAQYAKAKAEDDRLQEDARKAEEKRLQEDVRKAEEARKMAEDREAEVKECNAKLTYSPQVWACPFGDYVSDPNDCPQLEGKTSPGDYAVQVDLGYLILPPGESCPLRVDRADVSHERLYDTVLGWVNFRREGKERPEGFDFDVETPVNQAFANWRKAEDRRLASIPYDCLAGICLNAPASSIPDKLVTVSEVVVHRKVEVCSGRVAAIDVSAGWVLPGYGGFVNILPGAQHKTYSDGTPAMDYVSQIRSEMGVLGWEGVLDYNGLWDSHASPTKKGKRFTGWSRADTGGAWSMYLTTLHPDKDALCASKRQQGL
jgi:hypothetical protein